MKSRSLLMGGALIALLGLGAVGCNENPIDITPTTGAPNAPTGLQASSSSTTSVILNWTAAADTGTITYKVSYSTTGTGGSGSVDAGAATTKEVTNLTAGQLYKFAVTAVRNGVESAADTLSWMGANRYTSDQATTTTIKMYEFASSKGSALALDNFAPYNGPRNLKTASDPPAVTQLAMIVDPGGTVAIGPAFAFPNFSHVLEFDPNVYISKNSFSANSLDSWFVSKSLDNYVFTSDATTQYNKAAISFPASSANGFGFFIRTGTAGGTNGYHYARVIVKSVGGKILQGSPDDRFVELEISYQSTPFMPYAKTAMKMKEAPIVGYAKQLR
jgi:hypothetical protein